MSVWFIKNLMCLERCEKFRVAGMQGSWCEDEGRVVISGIKE